MTDMDLAPLAPGVLVQPATGEVVSLDGPIGELAGAMDAVRALETRLRTFKAAIGDELLARMDHAAVWTVREDGWEVTGESPGRVDYDAAALATALAGLVDRGVIAEDALDAAVKFEPSVRKAGTRNLLALGGEVRDTVEACQVPGPPRRVRGVRRLAPAITDTTATEV